MRVVFVLGLACALAGVAAAASQQAVTSAQATGAISGVVLDGVTQKPIAGAVVVLSGSPANATGNPNAPPPGTISMMTSASGTVTTLEAPAELFRQQRQLTNEQGRFVFTSLPGNMAYSITASRYGYFDAAYGRASTSGSVTNARRIVLVDGQWFRDARIEMVRPSAINGRVLDETGDPMVGVTVKLYTEIFVGGVRQTAGGPIALTDDRGVYRIGNLSPGRYLVAVPSVQHAVPATMTTAELSGQAAAALAASEPTRRDPSFAGTGYRTVLAQNAPPPSPSAAGPLQIYPTTFHPAALSTAEATSVELQAGDDRPAIDIQLRPAPVFRISGRLDGPPEAMGGLSLRLMTAGLESLGGGAETATSLVSADGSFSFLNVPNGAYTIVGNRTITEYTFRPPGSNSSMDLPNPPGVRYTSMSMGSVDSGTVGTGFSRRTYQGNLRYQARQPVSVGGRDVVDLIVPMQAGISIRGEVMIESSAPANSPSQTFLSLRAEPANGDASLGQPYFNRSPASRAGGAPESNEFLLEGLMPGAYYLRGPANIKSIMWNGRDYSDIPFDTTTGRDITGVVVTLTDKVSTLSGAIRDRTGQPAANTAVIVFAADRTKWSGYGMTPTRIKSTPGSTRGVYSLRGLPAGEYLAVAIDDDFAARWKDPAFLEATSRVATRFTIGWGETQTLDLVVQEIK